MKTQSARDVRRKVSAKKRQISCTLKETGVRVSNGAVVHTIEEALKAFKRLVTPVIVKPVIESRGRGQSLNLRTESELWTAFFNAKKYSESVWVEENFDRDFIRLRELQ